LIKTHKRYQSKKHSLIKKKKKKREWEGDLVLYNK
jgi:hypothetical protein